MRSGTAENRPPNDSISFANIPVLGLAHPQSSPSGHSSMSHRTDFEDECVRPGTRRVTRRGGELTRRRRGARSVKLGPIEDHASVR